MGYVDQSRDSLNADKTVFEEISGGTETIVMGGTETSPHVPTSHGSTSRVRTRKRRSASLSGGERNRVHLAKLLRQGCNVCCLDEPTNDLDVDTLRALEEAIANFAGCVVVTSHDRWFLDRLATHILAFEGDGETDVV